MTIRRTTALILSILLGISVAVLATFVAPRPLVLVLLRDDFSDRKIMKDDPKEPEPKEEATVFAPPTSRTEEPRDVELPRPAGTRTPRRPDPLEMTRTRSGAYDPLPLRR